MSRLDELIQGLCPDGVEYRVLNTFCKIYDGTHSTPNYTDSGVKFVSVENINDLYATAKHISEADFKKYKIKPQINDVLMTRIGSIGVCTVIDRDEPLAYYVSLALIRPNNNTVDSKYLKYVIESIHGRKELRKRTLVNAVPIKVNKDDIGKIKLPIPPLPVQEEIVRILDTFTSLTAELQAELQARRKQYEYYRNELLKPNKATPLVRLGEFASIIRGGNFQKKDFVEKGYPCIHYGQMYTHFGVYATEVLKYLDLETFEKSKKANKNDIIMAVTSENVDDVCTCTAWLGEETIAVSGHTAIIHHQQNAKYLSYYFRTDHFYAQKSKLAHGTKVIEVTPAKLLECIIPLPSIQEQNYIVSILDRFDALCNDISAGLPAEIETRQKQYEYYRDKLLTFKELS